MWPSRATAAGDRAVERGLEASIDGGPRGRIGIRFGVATAPTLCPVRVAAPASACPTSVASAIAERSPAAAHRSSPVMCPYASSLSSGLLGGSSPSGSARGGRREPVDRGADAPELRGGVGRVLSELGVLGERPQRLAEPVVLPGLADEQPVGLLEGVHEAQVLCGRGVQAHEVERLRLDRRVADPECLVLKPVGTLHPARGGLVRESRISTIAAR